MIHVTSDALYLYNTLIINTWQNVITVYSIYQLADYFDQLSLALYLQKTRQEWKPVQEHYL